MGRVTRIVGWRGRWFMRTMRARQTRPRRQASIAARRGATADTPGGEEGGECKLVVFDTGDVVHVISHLRCRCGCRHLLRPVRVGVRAPWNSMELRGTPWNSVLSLGLTHHEGRPMSSGLVSKEFEAFARDCVQLAAQADSQELRERLLSIARDWMRAAMEEDDATPSTNRALRRRKLQPSRGAA
jgi:hypothetical protein